MGRSLDIDDPLTVCTFCIRLIAVSYSLSSCLDHQAAIAPPPDESPSAREARLRNEQEAKRINDEIDEQLRSERAAVRRKKKPVKVLLLGQSESGKTATLKSGCTGTWLMNRADSL